jgi:hypothetical protein
VVQLHLRRFGRRGEIRCVVRYDRFHAPFLVKVSRPVIRRC